MTLSKRVMKFLIPIRRRQPIKRLDARTRTSGGFTLVELLVVVTLMSLLSGMMSIALSSARQDARIKRAEAEVRTISTILQQKINDINLAPVPILGNTIGAANSIEINRVNMLARRDLMRMSLPQCRADLIYPPARLQFGLTTGAASSVKIEQPSEWAQMRRVAGFTNPSGVQVEFASSVTPFSLPGTDSIGLYNGSGALRTALGALNGYVIDLTTAPWPETNTPLAGETWTRDFESAECLYLILASTRVFGDRALDQLNPRSIANLDGDAIPEIVDPWGNPYEFIRDPVGRVYREVKTTPLPTEPHPAGADATDYLRTDFRFQNNDGTDVTTLLDDPFKIYPLLISAGPDGNFGLRTTFNRNGILARDTIGISPRTSTAAIQLTGVPSATLSGSFQYPDPYLQLRNGSSAPYQSQSANLFVPWADLSNATLAGWHGSGGANAAVGLGAGILLPNGSLDPAFGDNIASDDPE